MSISPFVGTPLDDLRPLAYTLRKTDFLCQATSRDLPEFYSSQDYVRQGNRIDALNISKMYLELDQVELYVVGPTLSETDRDARLAGIKTQMTTIQRRYLRRLNQTTTCPFELFEHIKTRFVSNSMDNNPTVVARYLRTLKFTDESCIDTLSVEIIDLAKRYSLLCVYDSAVVQSSGSIGHLVEVVTNSVATARAANHSVVVADVWASVRCIITNCFQRASALGDNRSAAIIQTRTQLAAVTHAVAAPAHTPHPKQLRKPMAQFML
ncbi:hypothetical protein H257_11916 [Aphanomyces astaci]|uniref:Uncharacterized protein n=1 Tax=Aphanomyces astaci TaxID=112090 RepID=W4G073_APHAT|nr:hypothetical protein H257_11916 [Aphanomyces astaci]ETV73092.1 hypothetical protein H257_11916 [Aphanomyces astaci]|eukprot:XP_009837297.1 hypothetical protein H257_11916 [Aphanomyces astaci]